MGRTVVDNPEDAAGIVVRRSGHYLLDQAVKGCDAVLALAATKDPGMVDIQAGDVGPGPAAKVLMLDLHAAPRSAGASGVFPASGLDACFLVGGDHKLIVFQRLSSPFAGVKIQQSARFFGEVGIAREDPTAVIPRPDGVLMQPPPKSAAADGSHQTGRADLSRQIGGAPAGQRQTVCGGEFAGPSLNLNDEIWGKKSGGDPDESVLLSRRGVREKTVCAKGRRHHGGCPSGQQLIVGQPFGRRKNHLGALDLKIR